MTSKTNLSASLGCKKHQCSNNKFASLTAFLCYTLYCKVNILSKRVQKIIERVSELSTQRAMAVLCVPITDNMSLISHKNCENFEYFLVFAALVVVVVCYCSFTLNCVYWV
uniref:Uncharacterized protein n=1 Tax=Glossina brevipalpis TaxID=37001 RepID=A0A1A9WXB0_9MUSC